MGIRWVPYPGGNVVYVDKKSIGIEKVSLKIIKKESTSGLGQSTAEMKYCKNIERGSILWQRPLCRLSAGLDLGLNRLSTENLQITSGHRLGVPSPVDFRNIVYLAFQISSWNYIDLFSVLPAMYFIYGIWSCMLGLLEGILKGVLWIKSYILRD